MFNNQIVAPSRDACPRNERQSTTNYQLLISRSPPPYPPHRGPFEKYRS
jgi:hypothetical protein